MDSPFFYYSLFCGSTNIKIWATHLFSMMWLLFLVGGGDVCRKGGKGRRGSSAAVSITIIIISVSAVSSELSVVGTVFHYSVQYGSYLPHVTVDLECGI